MSRQLQYKVQYPCVQQLHTRGTHYDVGYNIGASLGQNMKLFLANSEDFEKKLLPFYHCQAGREYFEESLKVTQSCFPQYVRELQGMADGSGLPFEHIFMMNVSKEVYSILYEEHFTNQRELLAGDSNKKEALYNDSLAHLQNAENEAACQEKSQVYKSKVCQESSGCSDVFINSPDCKFLVHNEDCDPAIKPYGYLLSVDIEEDGNQEQFTSFCYPACLPGCAFGFNGHGLTVSVDGLYAAKIVRDSPGRMFLNRALLAAKDLEDARKILENEPYGIAYGFCANITTHEHEMYSIEISPSKPKADINVYHVSCQVQPMSPCHYYHFNSYKHQKTPEKGVLRSSVARTKRADELPAPRNLDDALRVMGDTQNTEYPIFRSPRPTDRSETVNTVVFNVKARQVLFYQDNPLLTWNRPLITLPMYK